MRICYIIGSGDFTPRELIVHKEDCVIAADGGYAHLSGAGIRPDLLVGDFDSLAFVPCDVETLRFPAEKDDTDMGLALRKGLELGYTCFRIYGGSGSRTDHFFANMQLALRASQDGCDIKLVCPDFTLHTLSGESTLTLKREPGTVFSVFAATDSAYGVSIKKAKYTLENATITNRFPLGVSNEFKTHPVEISVSRGSIWIFEYISPDFR